MTRAGFRRFDTTACIGALALVAFAAVVFAAHTRGIWLDEFWSQRLGDPDMSLAALAADRWLSDTHPPLANLLYRLVSATGITSISAQRLALNLPALFALTAATFVMARRSGVAIPVIFAGALALAGTVEAFADFRSYAWQIAAITVLFQYTVLLFSDRSAAMVDHAIGAIALYLALSLHYVTAIQISIFVVGLVAALVAARRWREALIIVPVAAIAWVSLLATGLVLLGRMQRDIDFGWIQTSTPIALLLFGFLLVTTLLSTPLVAYFAVKGAREAANRSTGRVLVGILLWTVVAGFVALIALNIVTPIIVQRYLVVWQLAVVALLAVLAEPTIAASRWRMFATFGFAVPLIVYGALQAAQTTGWNENRDWIADRISACPATTVYALSPWALKTARASNSARRETAVILDSYRKMAREKGFAVTTLDLADRHRIDVSGTCPTLVWIEHIDPSDIPDAAYILRVGGLEPSMPVATNLSVSGSGVVLALTPQKPGQNRREMPK